MEAKLKAMLGDYAFAIAALTAQLEATQRELAKLKAEGCSAEDAKFDIPKDVKL